MLALCGRHTVAWTVLLQYRLAFCRTWLPNMADVPVCSHVRFISTQTHIRRWQGRSDNNKYTNWALFSLSLCGTQRSPVWACELFTLFPSLTFRNPHWWIWVPLCLWYIKPWRLTRASLSSCILFDLLLNWCCVFLQWPHRNSNKSWIEGEDNEKEHVTGWERMEERSREQNHCWRFYPQVLHQTEVKTENALWHFSTITLVKQPLI